MGFIPDLKNWSIETDYRRKKTEIDEITIKDIKLDKTDVDLVRLQGGDIEELKRERLINEKERRIKELDDSFGIEPEEQDEKPEYIDFREDSEGDEAKEKSNHEKKLWEILEGKGLIDKK